jgi:hypothetical protein
MIPTLTLTEADTLTDAELAWVWKRYRCCTFPVASFPKRFARNALESLTPDKGHPMAIRLSYQYRRQIFNPKAAKWTLPQFLDAVRQTVAKL